ncbi:ubiquitin [Clostridium perfringens]|uniref:ubiquitin n=1 Tax=Clostridium perfringens TaxID=1502 RepID=UPI0018E46E70|nr:ubiquitin [Clostridium perfringens]EHK2304587.1 ubiquitin [Clostridium perfringens]MBI6083459.1 ubiquitin [Clostridium perfringens]MBI6101588.1 ubiquitin [Clostridium perfringens]MBO3319241.1 ubiquitin [Clostridium perfringens]MDK0545602.1 ubiquitin [Clostridium perfringens]
MEKLKLVDKLKNKANISYEEAKDALEKSNWDMLEAMLYLEAHGKVEKPSLSIFYTNESKESYNENGEEVNLKEDTNENNFENKNSFEGVFEAICKAIDTCNNIFIEIIRNSRVILKIPFTVLIVLLFFAFWIVIPLMIIGLFFNMEFLVSSKKIDVDKINKVFKETSKVVKDVKGKFTNHMH